MFIGIFLFIESFFIKDMENMKWYYYLKKNKYIIDIVNKCFNLFFKKEWWGKCVNFIMFIMFF